LKLKKAKFYSISKKNMIKSINQFAKTNEEIAEDRAGVQLAPEEALAL